MTELRQKILEAAVRVFMRYGVGKTRMNDIAQETGIARPTLYASFKNKDEILSASILHYSDLSLAGIRHEWDHLEKLSDKLDVFYERAIIASFQIITASPDARDMIGGHNAVGKAATKKAQLDKMSAWAELLEQYLPADEQRPVSSEQLAQYIVLSSLGLRDHAENEIQLRQLLQVQKQGILALLNCD
ncbi:TetR/AcrR family transcriptional regulator [Roseibium sp. SCP14]|uniref:TetR/AcrR family transcriptional regulator n=1 Tax=Roseibium sp. SCP14 TaxID=3141375 RepID=UPI0033384578